MLTSKPVILREQVVGHAATLTQAATVAKMNGVAVNPNDPSSVVQHVGEGPRAFYVAEGLLTVRSL